MMKTKIYLILSAVFMLALAGCSDSDDGEEPAPQPGLKKGYVSRIKVTDLTNVNSDTKTIKVYYDSQRRVTGVHWGTTVPGRSAWKFEYAAGKINFKFSGDPTDSKRYCILDNSGMASELVYEDSEKSSHAVYTYNDSRLTGISEHSSTGTETASSLAWNIYGTTDIDTRVGNKGNDSIRIKSSITYDEFATNNSNIDLNVILDAISGITPAFNNAPMLLEVCGVKPAQLILRHKQDVEYANSPELNTSRCYQVVTYSVQQGRIATLEIENKADGSQKRVDVVYKAD